eukprot:XP_001611813.1 hypothetical protein [Babesia bovis T2Bo]
MGQEYFQMRPESPPWITEDFGGVPNLPHRTPIALSRGPVDEEFLEMRKRGIPHSMLKDYYMYRDEYESRTNSRSEVFHPIFRRSPEDNNLYLYGQGVATRPSFEMLNEDGVLTTDELDADDEHLKKALEIRKSYKGSDRICQIMLATLKEYNDANLKPLLQEPAPEGEEVDDPMFRRSFLVNEDGSPYWLNEWNREYLKGREGLSERELIDYDNMWYTHLEKLEQRYGMLLPGGGDLDDIMQYFETVGQGDLSLTRSSIRQPGGLRVAIGNKVLKTRWSENIPPVLLELLMKYTLMDQFKSFKKMNAREQLLNMKADALKSCNQMIMNRLIRERVLRNEEKKRLEYIKFLHHRRKVIHKSRITGQPNIPYWLWEECWHRKDDMIQDTIVEILHQVKAVEPDADVAELTRGTVEHMKSPKLLGTKFDRQLILENDMAGHVDVLESYIKKHSQGAESENEETTDAPNKINDETIDGIDLPLPLGYYFRDMISFDKFEKAFEDFNMECFGRKGCGVRVGQLVKGVIEDVRPKRLLVDIHTSKLAVMYLSDFFRSPREVPSGGFTKVFQKGDELYFEIVNKLGNDIRLSTRRLQEMYSKRDIYRKHFENEIFKVRALQRYSQGVLVQYQGDDVVDIKNYKCPENPGGLENIAFIPLDQLDNQYLSDTQLIRLDIIGKVLPVFISDWAVCAGVPLVSNTEAIKRLPLGHIKPGDRIRAKRCMYGKDAVWLDLGKTIGTLSVMDMSPEDYQKHKLGDATIIYAEVKNVHMVMGYVELTTKFSSEGNKTNEWIDRLHSDPDPVQTFNKKLAHEKELGNEMIPKDMTKLNYVHPIDQLPSMIVSENSEPNLPFMKPDESIGLHKVPIKWDFTPTAAVKNPEDEVNYAYHQYRWEVLTENGWEVIMPEEQRILNRARFMNDEVIHYNIGSSSYRADLVEMIRQNLTEGMEQPLRNDAVLPLDEVELRHTRGFIDIDFDPGAV